MQSEISQKAKDIAEEIKRRTAMNCWKLHIRPDLKRGFVTARSADCLTGSRLSRTQWTAGEKY